MYDVALIDNHLEFLSRDRVKVVLGWSGGHGYCR
jgi:hypothetical protein